MRKSVKRAIVVGTAVAVTGAAAIPTTLVEQMRNDLGFGTVVTASSSLLAPALRDLHARHGSGGVEVVNGRQVDIQQGLAEGSLDLGLVNVLPGDEVPPTLVADRLIEGTPVACLPVGHPRAAGAPVHRRQLRRDQRLEQRPQSVADQPRRRGRRRRGHAQQPAPSRQGGTAPGALQHQKSLKVKDT